MSSEADVLKARIAKLKEGDVFEHSGQLYKKLKGGQAIPVNKQVPRSRDTTPALSSVPPFSTSAPTTSESKHFELRKTKADPPPRKYEDVQDNSSSRKSRSYSISQDQPGGHSSVPSGFANPSAAFDEARSSRSRLTQYASPTNTRDVSEGREDRQYSIRLKNTTGSDLRPGQDDKEARATKGDSLRRTVVATSDQRHRTSDAVVLNEEDEDQDENDSDTFRVLRGSAKAFAALAQNDFRGRAAFLSANPDVLRCKLDEFYEEAVRLIGRHKITTALGCMQSLVILRLCQDTKTRHLADQVLEMQREDSEQYYTFQEMFEQVLRGAQAQAAAKVDKKKDPIRPTKASAGYTSEPRAPTRHERHDSKLGGSAFSPDEVKKQPPASREQEDPADEEHVLEGMTESNLSPLRMDRALRKIDPSQFKDERMRLLSDKYQVPENGRTFFVAGKVFSLLWHEPAGEPRGKAGRSQDTELGERDKVGDGDKLDPNITIGPYGSRIYSHIRRMVVLRNRKGYCWCLGINSYGGLGLKKPGLKKEETKAHTIVHDRKYKATALPEEPRMFKDPIAVNMISGQTLTAASRLHYGKPYVVEWNTRVMNVGQVDGRSMAPLMADAAWELLGEKTAQP